MAESTWHESQKLTPQGDGSLLAEFDLSNTEEIKRWILSFGRHAEVVEPEELRADVIAELNALQDVYGATGAAHSDALAEGKVSSTAMRGREADQWHRSDKPR